MARKKKLSLKSDLKDILEVARKCGSTPNFLDVVERSVDIGRSLRGFRLSLYGCGGEDENGDLYELLLLLYVGYLVEEVEDKEESHLPHITAAAASEIRELCRAIRSGCVEQARDWLGSDSEARRQVHEFALSDFFLKPNPANIAERNPFVATKCASKALAFLKEEHGYDRTSVHRGFSDAYPLTDEHLVLLLHTWHAPRSLFAKLMAPLKLLTHQENFRVQLQHARLLIFEANIPVAFASDVTYKDLANVRVPCLQVPCLMASPAEREEMGKDSATKLRAWHKEMEERLDDPQRLPSSLETEWRKRAAKFCRDAIERGGMVAPPRLHCKDLEPLLRRRLTRAYRPILWPPGEEERELPDSCWRWFTSGCEMHGLVPEEELYGEWRYSESKEMFALLMRE